MSRRLTAIFCLPLLLLAACKDITHVQTGYVGDRDECRSKSENNVGVYSQPESYPLSDKERSSALLQLFCECMKERDWKVAGCPKPVVVAATPAPQAPTVVVVQSPTAQPGFIAPPPPAPAPEICKPIPKGVKKKKHPLGACPEPDYSSPNTPPEKSDQQLNGILQRQ